MVYTPQRGFAQSQYFDQQATALAGMLANASDINLVDSAFVGQVDPVAGLTAGIGVQILPTVASNRPGLNYDVAIPPQASATDADFAGIVVRNQFMRTNAAGEACYFYQDMCNYARRGRAGSRIWVELAFGSTVFGGDVYWIVRDTANEGKKIGAFAGAAIAGTETPTPGIITGGSINLNETKAVTAGGFDVTASSNLVKVSGLDLSTAGTVAEVAAAVQTAMDSASASTFKVAVHGSGLQISTVATGAAATITFASAPTAVSASTDASSVLALTAAMGASLQQGSAGASEDTVKLTNARFLGTFTASAAPNNIALIELL